MLQQGYILDSQRVGVCFVTGARDFSLLHNVRTHSGAHSASETVGTFPWTESGQGSCTSTPQHVFMARCFEAQGFEIFTAAVYNEVFWGSQPCEDVVNVHLY